MIRNSLVRLICAALLLIFYAESTLANPPKCDSRKRLQEWTGCIGTFKYPSGDYYDGEFYQGMFHGVGAFIVKDGVQFVGQYDKGIRRGYGIEFGPTGQLIRQGVWNGGLVRYEVVDRTLFKRGSALSFNPSTGVSDQKNEPLSDGDLARMAVEAELAAAKEKIKTLKAELERARGASKNSGSSSSLSLVNKCLQKGLRSGTPEFSKCIASDGAAP